MVFTSKVVPSNIRQSVDSSREVLSEKGTFFNPIANHNIRNDPYFLRYSVAKSTVTNVGETGKYNDQDHDEISSQDPNLTPSNKSLIESCKSIKFFVIILITLLVVASSFVLSGTWLSAFIPAISDFSFDVRQGENEKLVMNIQQTMNEAIIVLETAKGQYHIQDLTNPAQIELSLYRFFQSEANYHGGLPLAVLLGNNSMSYSVLQWGPIPTFIEIGPVMQNLYYCAGLSADYCVRSSTPSLVMPSFDLSLIISTAEKRPGKPTFTPSYSVGGSIIFVTLVTSWKANVVNQTANSSPISNYLSYALTTDKLSKYLKKLSQEMDGSKAMIIETNTNYLLAIDNETSILAVQEGETVVRKTPLNIDIKEYRDIGEAIYRAIPNLQTGIECNSYKNLVLSSNYIMMHRICSDYNMDWVIAVSTPQWDYISPIIYALIAALCGSAIVLGISVFVGILFSVKIVRPFKNLMLMFESVSNMELDNVLGLTTSAFEFSEMKYVKVQFQEMLKKLKLYRAFIPSHLLQEIEGEQQQPQESVGNSLNNSQLGNSNVKHSSHSSKSGSKHTLNSSLKSSQYSSVNKFSLYIEVKQVSFVGIFIEGLEMWYLNAETNGTKELLSLLSDIFEQVNTASRVSGCHFDTFDNDLIILSFNSSKDQKNHIEKALSLSQNLLEKLKDVKQSKYKSESEKHRKSHGTQLKNHHLVDGLNFRIAVISQKVYCGNVGTSDSKFFSVVSSMRKNLDQLIEVAHRLEISIVFPERIYQKASEMYQTRFVDLKELVDDSFLSPSCFLNSSSCLSPEEASEPNIVLRSQLFTKEAIYELGESNQVENDQEWMYELNHKQKLLKWKKYQEACVAFFSDQYEQALTLFEEFLAERSVKESASLFSARQDEGGDLQELAANSSSPSIKQSHQPPLDKPAMNFVRICRMKIENL
nr:unnamed protein product [Naegleria fowleri]